MIQSGPAGRGDATDRSSEGIPPWWQPSRLIRSLTGVDERLLAGVPSERPHYTVVGMVVLGTALLATLSMGISLHSVLGRREQRIIVPAMLVWFVFILGVDRYLMAPSITARKAISRVCLTVAFGVVIAEGLLLGMFRTAIVNEHRATAVASQRNDLMRCNPIPDTGQTQAPGGREGTLLTVSVKQRRDALQKQLRDEKAEAKTLSDKVKNDADAYAQREQKAREECNGVLPP